MIEKRLALTVTNKATDGTGGLLGSIAIAENDALILIRLNKERRKIVFSH